MFFRSYRTAHLTGAIILGDIESPRLLYVKGGLFVVLGSLSVALLIAEQPTVKTVALLALCIWSFCRAYFFAFYVVQHYADPAYRFAGLCDFAKYCCQRHSLRDGLAGKVPKSPSLAERSDV